MSNEEKQAKEENQLQKKVLELARKNNFFLRGLNKEEVDRAIYLFREFCVYDLGRDPTVTEEILIWKAIDSYLRSCRNYPEKVPVFNKEGDVIGHRFEVNRELSDRNRDVIMFLRELKITPLAKEYTEQANKESVAKIILDAAFGKQEKKK